MLDDAVAYLAEESLIGAHRLLEDALSVAVSLATLCERGRVVPEVADPDVRELFVKHYRLIYEVHEAEVRILAFLHGARDFEQWRRET